MLNFGSSYDSGSSPDNPSAFANRKLQTKWVAGGYVSTYFYNAFMAVWNGRLGKSFEALLAAYPNYQVWVPYSYRVVHWRDIVPHIPMEGFEGYWHHNSEVSLFNTFLKF
ncbi:hypothetical protein ANCDUO_02889 [Ancylostoma duodenale]|uniref:Uncharacterized protein n=1 Tax=Ancylostoma duodenale TaxID=51022 RepID=A0A0C2HBB6_9BILA|nr:hypothetical protein ANCDUO_02889 [Ancylostoma duodenale]